MIRRLSILVALLLTAVLPIAAQQPVSHQTLSVSNTGAVGLAAATISPANVGPVSSCVLAVEGGPIRYWVDGTAPTASSGFLANVGNVFSLPSQAYIAQFQAIATTAAAATTLQVSCARGAASSAGAAMASDLGLQPLNTQNPFAPLQLIGGFDASGSNGTMRAAAVAPGGSLYVAVSPGLPLPPCNPVRTVNCQPKGF